MRVLIKTLLLLFPICAIAQTFPAPLQVRRIYNITSSTTCIDNRSQTSGQNNYHSFLITGSGSFSAQLQYSDTSCSGPWTSYGSAALVTQASNPAIGFANDGFNTYHKFISFAITGTPSINYSAAKDFFLSTSVGGVVFPVTLSQGGLGGDFSAIAKGGLVVGTGSGTAGIKTVGSLGQVLLVDQGQAGGIRWYSNIAIQAPLYNFSTLSPSGTLSAGIAATVTLTPFPFGLNGTDTNHYLYIPTCSGGAQKVLVTGGTGTSGAASGTVIFTPTNSCNAGYTVISATAGIQEAVNANPNVAVKLPRGTYNLYAPISISDTSLAYDLGGDINDQNGGSTILNVLHNGDGIIRAGSSSGNHTTHVHDLLIVGNILAHNGIYIQNNSGIILERLWIDGFTNQSSGVVGNGVYLNQCFGGLIFDVSSIGNSQGIAIDTSNNMSIWGSTINGNINGAVVITGGVGTESISNRIENSDIEGNSRALVATNALRTTVAKNEIESNTLASYFGPNTIGVVFDDNINVGPGVYFDSADYVEACRNTFQGSTSHLEIVTFSSLVYKICPDNKYILGSPIFPNSAQFGGTVTAAATTTLPLAGDWFDIAVGVGINTITASWSGREVALHFQGATVVTSGSNLKLSGNFTSVADSTLTLKSDNVNWIEQSRSIPGGNSRPISFTIGSPGGSALTVAATTTDYFTVPFACKISAYNLAIDAGTITVKFWKVATGTAIPTSANSISTSGVGISSGTAIHSTTVSDFTTTTVAANDIIAVNVTAVATAKYLKAVLQCDQ